MATEAKKDKQVPPAGLERDRFSSLPVEILAEIFRLAYEDGQPSSGPISRALVPFDRASRCRRLAVRSTGQLQALAKVLEAGQMGGWVKDLELENVDEGGRAPMTERQLKAFFASLPHLARLDLGAGCAALLRAVLSRSIARASLPRMTTLSFEAPPDWKNPFEPSLLSQLTSYPALEALQISSTKTWYDVYRVKLAKKKPDRLTNISKLTLHGRGVDLPVISRIIQACPFLAHLTLLTKTQHPNFEPILPLLPANLKSLELKTLAFFDDFSQPCDALLLRFTSLEHLYLGEGTYGGTIFDTLRALPSLTSLGFGKGAIVDEKQLIALLEGPKRLPTLKRLTLDITEGKRGYKLKENDYRLHPNHADDPDSIGPGWVPPRFTGSSGSDEGPFSERAPPRIMEAARAGGVVATGTAFEAVRILDEWYDELGLSQMMAAFETGNFDRMREVLGDEEVDRILEEEFGDGFGCECGECW
ncbi:hypothetical protein JCM10213_006152 [Rhodosporidiobolus nylandii]